VRYSNDKGMHIGAINYTARIDNLDATTIFAASQKNRNKSPPIRRLFFGITKVPGHVWTSVVCDVLISVCGVRIRFL
jgi:hypothetical protein